MSRCLVGHLHSTPSQRRQPRQRWPTAPLGFPKQLLCGSTCVERFIIVLRHISCITTAELVDERALLLATCLHLRNILTLLEVFLLGEETLMGAEGHSTYDSVNNSSLLIIASNFAAKYQVIPVYSWPQAPLRLETLRLSLARTPRWRSVVVECGTSALLRLVEMTLHSAVALYSGETLPQIRNACSRTLPIVVYR